MTASAPPGLRRAPAERRPGDRWAAAGRRTAPLVAAVLLVAAVHLLVRAATGSASPAAAALPAAAAAALWACGRLAGLSGTGSAVAAALAVASPLAVATSPGAGALALLAGAATVAGAGALARRTAAGRRSGRAGGVLPGAAVVAGLGAATLLAAPLAAALGPATAGWGTGERAEAGRAALDAWLALDPALPLLGLLAATAALLVPGRRTVGPAALLGPALVVVLGLPAAALAPVAGAAGLVTALAAEPLLERVLRRAPGRPVPSHRALPAAAARTGVGGRGGARGRRAPAAVAVLAAVAAVAPSWVDGLRRPPLAAAATPAGAAVRWVAQEVPPDQRVVVDAALYARAAAAAGPGAGLVPLSDGDGAPVDGRPAAWLLSTPLLRRDAVRGSWAARALAASALVRAFGQGDGRVEVRRLSAPVPPAPPPAPTAAAPPAPTPPPGATPARAPGARPSAAPAPAAATPAAPAPVATASASPTATAASRSAVRELADNPRLRLSATARRALLGGPVDLRLAALLATVAALQPISVADLPPAEDGVGGPLRDALVDGVDGAPLAQRPDAVAQLRRVLKVQDPAFSPVVTVRGSGTGEQLLLELPPVG